VSESTPLRLGVCVSIMVQSQACPDALSEYTGAQPPLMSDEAVAPCGVAAGAEHVQHALALLGGFVDGLDGLERQRDAQRGDLLADLVELAVPDKFGQARPLIVAGRPGGQRGGSAIGIRGRPTVGQGRVRASRSPRSVHQQPRVSEQCSCTTIHGDLIVR